MDDDRKHGRPLARFPRSETEELRVSLDRYKGHPFVSLRVWWLAPNGTWYPVRDRGCSIRLAEIGGLIRALAPLDNPFARRAREKREKARMEAEPIVTGGRSDPPWEAGTLWPSKPPAELA